MARKNKKPYNFYRKAQVFIAETTSFLGLRSEAKDIQVVRRKMSGIQTTTKAF